MSLDDGNLDIILRRNTLLSAHLVGEGLVDLSGKLYPGSIRDQIIRAFSVTDALWELQLLTASHRLLVIGAGPAGVASAIRASQLGVPVWLVEKDSDALSMLSASPRVISPALYD
jgi:NADPH-dependent 2,4-dienoyl-CoA reductase/sulfur reductase-like enzyme